MHRMLLLLALASPILATVRCVQSTALPCQASATLIGLTSYILLYTRTVCGRHPHAGTSAQLCLAYLALQFLFCGLQGTACCVMALGSLACADIAGCPQDMAPAPAPFPASGLYTSLAAKRVAKAEQSSGDGTCLTVEGSAKTCSGHLVRALLLISAFVHLRRRVSALHQTFAVCL